MLDAVGGQSSAGPHLKSTSGWNDSDGPAESGNGMDDFGFSALPAGFGAEDGYFDNEGFLANFWSSTKENNYRYAYSMTLFYTLDGAGLCGYFKFYGFSVRCLKD